jgi:hypothetical protein
MFLVWPWNPKNSLQKSVFFKCWTVSILFDLLSSKVALPFMRAEKKFLLNCPQRVLKEVEFCVDFKNPLDFCPSKKIKMKVCFFRFFITQVLLLELSTLHRPELHLDVSILQRHVLHIDVSKITCKNNENPWDENSHTWAPFNKLLKLNWVQAVNFYSLLARSWSSPQPSRITMHRICTAKQGPIAS